MVEGNHSFLVKCIEVRGADVETVSGSTYLAILFFRNDVSFFVHLEDVYTEPCFDSEEGMFLLHCGRFFIF